MIRFRYIICFFLVLVNVELSTAQQDTEFWFAAPDAFIHHNELPVRLYLSALDQDANITISLPANPGFTPITDNIQAGLSRSFFLDNFINQIECKPANQVVNTGILITSDVPISAFYELYIEWNPDIFVLKGNNALGLEFYVPGQNVWENWTANGEFANSSFDIVATEDNTELTITPSVNIVGRVADVPFTITLNRGQCYSGAAVDIAAANHVGGSHIVASKPIAVTLKDDSMVNGGGQECKDMGGDQLIPIDLIGQEYIVVKGQLDPEDRIFVTPIEDNTQIFRDGSTAPIAFVNAGEILALTLDEESTYITGDKAFYLLHATGNGCELGMAVLPPLECTGSNLVRFTRSIDQTYRMILITEAGNEDFFELNGTPLLNFNQFDFVPGTDSQWVAANYNLGAFVASGAPLEVRNDVGLFHLGIMNGSSGSRYGYFSEYVSFALEDQVQDACPGSPIMLTLDTSYNYEWYLNDSLVHTGDTLITALDDTTIYEIVSIINSSCSASASITVNTYPQSDPNISGESVICGDASITLSAEAGFSSYSWSNGESNPTIEVDSAGTYSVTIVDANGCTSVDTFVVMAVDPSYVLSLPDTIFGVSGETIDINPNINFNPTDVQWDPSDNLSCDSCINTSINLSADQTLTVTVISPEGCLFEAETFIEVFQDVQIPNAFSPNNDQVNDVFTILGESSVFTVEQFLIYNRWGDLVFENRNFPTNTANHGWDGTIGGKPQPSEVYMYYAVIKTNGGAEIIKYGDVLLLR